ncbi:hypothetical protein JZU69_01105 [bacterium]|nr:hypothetical protein [bacterium]
MVNRILQQPARSKTANPNPHPQPHHEHRDLLSDSTFRFAVSPPPPPPPPPVQAHNDIISDILSRVISMAPNFSLALAEQIDRETRQMWGGDRPYISTRKGAGSSSRNDRIKSDYQKGERVALLMRRYDLSASRIREILKE